MVDNTVTLEWGAPDLRAAVGIVQSCGENSTEEHAEAKDEQGKTIELRSYSSGDELSVEALITTGVTAPKAGMKVTIASGDYAGDYLCTSANKTRSNTDYTKVSITLTRKDSAAIVPSRTASGL